MRLDPCRHVPAGGPKKTPFQVSGEVFSPDSTNPTVYFFPGVLRPTNDEDDVYTVHVTITENL